MRRWSGLAGVVFVVLAFASRAVRGSVPDTDTRDALARFSKFYADGTHNDHALVAIVLGFIGLFAFAWFLGGLWSMLRAAEGGATMPTIIVAVGVRHSSRWEWWPTSSPRASVSRCTSPRATRSTTASTPAPRC